MSPNAKAKRKARILEIAEHHDFCVHIYSWSATDMRRLTRRMVADGELVMRSSTATHFMYRTPTKPKGTA